jgi:hypothetical protein
MRQSSAGLIGFNYPSQSKQILCLSHGRLNLHMVFRNAVKCLGLTSDLVTPARILCTKLVVRSIQHNSLADVRFVMWLSYGQLS